MSGIKKGVKAVLLATALQCVMPSIIQAQSPINTKFAALVTALSMLMFTGEQTKPVAGVSVDKAVLAAATVTCFALAYVFCPRGRRAA